MPRSPLPAADVLPKGRRILALALSALGLFACGGAPSGPDRPPNVLLVSIDTLRADHLSCYGYERETTPRIDALAREGVLFERAWATSSWTLPSHLSLLTGLPVSAHGICDDRLWTRTDEEGEPLPVTMVGTFLSEVLADAGYRTGGFYTWKYLEPRFGFGPGFEVYERLGHTFYSYPPVAERFEALREAGDTEGMKALAAEYPELFDATRPSSPETIDRALEWIDGVHEETAARPFFCFLHLFDVHDPYTPPPPFDTRFDPDYQGEINGKRITSPDSPMRGDMDPRDLEHVIALYDGEIAWVDSEVGRLVDELERRGLLEDTLVVITSDHGEEFYEHGNKTHRHGLWVESVGVPLILYWPRGLARGLRVREGSGIIDVAPTVCGLLGLPIPEETLGRDLSRVAAGEEDLEETTYLTELLVFDEGPVPGLRVGLHRGSEHVLLSAGSDRRWSEWYVFDLDEDPREADPGEALRLGPVLSDRLRVELDAVRNRQRELRDRSRRRPAGDLSRLSPAELAELAATGYLGVGESRPGTNPSAPPGRLCLDGCVWPDREE